MPLAAAEKFVKTQMTKADLISILRYSGGAVDILLDFTDDRSRLLSVIQTLMVGEGQGYDEETADASTSDTGPRSARMIQSSTSSIPTGN